MKLKNTLIIFVLALGVFLFIQFYESKQDNTPKKEYYDSRVAVFNADTIDAISITNNEGKIELRKVGDTGWEMVSPVKDRADIVLANQLLHELEGADVEDAFEADGKTAGNPSLKDVGLENSNVRLKLSGPDAPQEVIFGNDTAVAGKMYVRLEGSKKVVVVKNTLKTLLQKKADDFRDHRLMDFNSTQVNMFDVKTAAGEIEVSMERDEWVLDKPLKARGDNQKITDLIAQTINTRIQAFLPETGANLATLGLAEPRGTITMSSVGGEKPAVLQIGLPVENDKAGRVYAKLSTRESIYVLPKSIEQILAIKPNDVRDKHLLRVNFDVVDRIHIEMPNKPKITLVRKEDDWQLQNFSDTMANVVLVKNFVTFLQTQTVTTFVSDVATDLPKYGLDKPQMKITFSSYASENTSETTAGELPFLTLEFGKIEGLMVYARLQNEPYIVALPRGVLESIPTDPAEWQDTTIFQYKPENITSLQITREGQNTLALERAGASTWKLAQGTGVLNQTALQSLLNTLSSLHTVRWTGSATKGLGLERPSLIISFTTSDKKTVKLNIGIANADSMWNAQVEGRAGAFLISRPDFEALHTDVMEADKPANPPAPVTSSSTAPTGVH